MIRFSPRFTPAGLKPEITCIFCILDSYSSRNGLEFILTAGINRGHMPKSLHHVGLALDFTWRGYKKEDEDNLDGKDVAAALSNLLGPTYDVVAEEDHEHLEFQPKYANIDDI